MTPIQASKKTNERLVFSNLKDNREIQTPKYKLGQLFVQLIFEKYSQEEIVQIIIINFIK